MRKTPHIHIKSVTSNMYLWMYNVTVILFYDDRSYLDNYCMWPDLLTFLDIFGRKLYMTMIVLFGGINI